jgi:hypothetical protein
MVFSVFSCAPILIVNPLFIIFCPYSFPAARLQSSEGIRSRSAAAQIPIVQHQNDGLPFPMSSSCGYTDQWAQSYLTSGTAGVKNVWMQIYFKVKRL